MTKQKKGSAVQQSNPRAPLAAASVAFGLGIWLASAIHRSAAMWATAAFLLILWATLAAVRKSIFLGYASAGLAIVAAGALAWVWMPQPNLTTPPQEFLFSEKIEVVGHVTNDGAMLAGRGPRERFDLETEELKMGEVRFTQPVGMRATLFSRQREADQDAENGSFPQLAYGDLVKFTAKLRMPRNFRNPGAFDYEGYLHGLGITAIASVAANEIEIVPGKTGDTLGFWRSRCRSSILRHVHDLWKGEDAALFAAMIVGDDSLLLRQVREEFQETGVYHLLVVSGMNVGLLALAVFWMARLLRAPQWIAALITIALSVFYAFVAGMGAPILRAVFMLSIYLLGRLFYRDRSALNATGFAALVVLAVSPHAWFEPSFQLTFLALLAISGISIPLLDRTSARLGRALAHFESTSYDLTLPPRLAQFRLDLRLIAGRLAGFTGQRVAGFLVTGTVRSALVIYDLLVVSSITQAVLVLPMRLYFHRAAIVGLPANLLVLPLAGLLMNSAVAAIALSYVSAFLAHIAAVIASSVLHWTLFCIVSLSRWNISQWRIPDPDLLVVLVSVAGIIVALATVHGRRRVVIAGTAVLFVSATVAALYRPAPEFERGKLEITAIDVGQGDSLLVVTPEGKTMLMDGGGAIGPFRGEFDYGEDVVSPYLWLALTYLTRPEGIGYLFIFVMWLFFYGGFKAGWFKKILLFGGVILPFLIFSILYMIRIHQETGQWLISKKAVGVQAELLRGGEQIDGSIVKVVRLGQKSEVQHIIKGVAKNVIQNIPFTAYHYLRAYHFALWLFLIFGLIRVRQAGGKLELFLASIVLFHLFSLSIFTGSTIRFSVPLIPISLFWAGAGVLEIQRRLQRVKISNPEKWVSFLIILAILVQLPQSMRPEGRSRADQKEVGLWLKQNTPPGTIIMSNSPIEAFYAEREFLLLPQGISTPRNPGRSYNEIISYAKTKGVRYILTNRNTHEVNPGFIESIQSKDLKEVFMRADRKSIIYEVIY